MTLQETRLDCALLQKQIAQQLGVTPRTVSRWEAGDQTPHLKYLRPLADVLNRSVDELRTILASTAAVAQRSSSPTIV